MTLVPPPPTPSHAEIFRHSVPIRVGAYYVLLASSALFAITGLYPLRVARITALTLGETLVLAVVYRRALASRSWAGLYLLVEATCQTAIFHASGDIRIAFAPTVYTFELINPGLRLGRRGHFVVANAFVALFASVVVAERLGILATHRAAALVVSPALNMSSIVIVLLCLNVAAYFIAAGRTLLESRTVELWYARQSIQAHSEELERRVQERTMELEQSYRALQEKSDELRSFSYNVTHDLKNPFNAILLTANLLLKRDGASVAEEREDLEQIARTAARGEAMLRDLLELFRVTSTLEPAQAVDLDPLVTQALDTLRPNIVDRRIRVDVVPLPRVWGQPQKLRHVLSNLLGNAVKYVPAGRGEIAIAGHRANGRVTIEVRDNGIGIPPAYHRRIFELFARVPSAQQRVDGEAAEGTGVGLAMVKRIVEEHHGETWVESAPGAGSAFFVRLPAADDPE